MPVRAFLRLIRFPNLILIALTMFSCRYFVIIPVLKFAESQTEISHFDFVLIVISVLLIAAGGYVINDYYDIEIDQVNKPDHVVVGKHISKQKAYLLFHVLGFAGILIAFYLSFFGGINYIAFVNFACAALLWIYAAYLKKMLLAGNILVSLLCAFTIFITSFYDFPARNAEPIRILIGGYAIFAFLVSMIREIIKDIQDLKGDLANGSKTFAIVAGIRNTKFLVSFLIISTVGLLGYVQFIQFESRDFLSLGYIGLAIQLPFIILFIRLLKSRDVSDFNFCSLLCKLIMVTGILSMPVFYLGFK